MQQGARTDTYSTQLFYNLSRCKLYTDEEKSFFKLAQCTCQKSSPAYRLTDEFQEEFNKEQSLKKHYISHKKRMLYEVEVQDGLFKYACGGLLNGILMYVLLPNHKLYAVDPRYLMHHSYLSSGLPVLAAGFLFCFSGLLVTVNNNSGHYKISCTNMRHALKWFSKASGNPHLIFEDHTLKGTELRFYKANEPMIDDKTKTLSKEEFAFLARSATDVKIEEIISRLKPSTDEVKSHYDSSIYYEEPIEFRKDEFAKDKILFNCFSSIGENNQRGRFHLKASKTR